MERFWIQIHWLRIKQMIKIGRLWEEYTERIQDCPEYSKTSEAASYKLSIAIAQLKITILQKILKFSK